MSALARALFLTGALRSDAAGVGSARRAARLERARWLATEIREVWQMSWLWWSLVSVLAWGLWGVVVKIAVRGLEWPQLLLFGAATSFAASALIGALLRPSLDVPVAVLLPAIAASLLGTLGVVTLYLALGAGGRASVVIPLTASYPVITATLSLLLLREQLDATKLLAAGLFIVATVLAAR